MVKWTRDAIKIYVFEKYLMMWEKTKIKDLAQNVVICMLDIV